MKTIQKIRLTRSQLRLLILAAVMISYFVLVLFFLLIPFQLKVRSLDSQVKTFFAESEKTQEMMLAVNRSGEKFETTLEKLEQYRQMAPTPDVLAGALDRAGSSAEGFRLSLVSFKPKAEEKIPTSDNKTFIEEGREARLLKVEATLKGSFFSLGNYLIALENAPHKIILKELDIRNPRMDPKTSAVSELEIRMELGFLTMRPTE